MYSKILRMGKFTKRFCLKIPNAVTILKIDMSEDFLSALVSGTVSGNCELLVGSKFSF